MTMLILLVLLGGLLVAFTAVILDSQVGRAFAARLESGRKGLDDGSLARLAALEQEVERLVQEVERLDEESTFLQRLLTEKKPDPDKQLPSGDGEA
jgi:hypothetical protein